MSTRQDSLKLSAELAEQLAEAPDVDPGVGDVAMIFVSSCSVVEARLVSIERGLRLHTRAFVILHVGIWLSLIAGLVIR